MNVLNTNREINIGLSLIPWKGYLRMGVNSRITILGWEENVRDYQVDSICDLGGSILL